MTPTAIIIFLTSLCTLAIAIIGVFTSLRNKKAIAKVEIAIDGRLTELLELTRRSSHAEGVIEGEAVKKD